jgi:hypothetical protein
LLALLLWLCHDTLGCDLARRSGDALGRAASPFAQALDVPRLREVEGRQNGQTQHRGQAGIGPDLLNDLGQVAEL